MFTVRRCQNVPKIITDEARIFTFYHLHTWSPSLSWIPTVVQTTSMSNLPEVRVLRRKLLFWSDVGVEATSWHSLSSLIFKSHRTEKKETKFSIVAFVPFFLLKHYSIKLWRGCSTRSDLFHKPTLLQWNFATFRIFLLKISIAFE